MYDNIEDLPKDNIDVVPKDYQVPSRPHTRARAKQLQNAQQGLINKLFIQEAEDGYGIDVDFRGEVGFKQPRLVNLL